MSITKIESRYMDAKAYMLSKIIDVAERINYRITFNIDCDKQLYLLKNLCYLYTNAFKELITAYIDKDEKIEKIVAKEEAYMIRKFSTTNFLARRDFEEIGDDIFDRI